MTTGIDDGEILKQRRFEIAPQEVSLTLNTRNFEAAIESFGELIDELATDTVQPVAQDFIGRVVYSKHDRPAAGCMLDWNRPADELDALVRATTFGRYPNPIGLAHALQAWRRLDRGHQVRNRRRERRGRRAWVNSDRR